MQAFAYVERIGSLGNELCPELAEKQQYLFPHRVDEGDFCKIDDQPHSGAVARHQRTSVPSLLAHQARS